MRDTGRYKSGNNNNIVCSSYGIIVKDEKIWAKTLENVTYYWVNAIYTLSSARKWQSLDTKVNIQSKYRMDKTQVI